MEILHNAFINEWNAEKGTGEYGKNLVTKDGFLHCSTAETFETVVRPKLAGIENQKLMLHIETEKLKSKLKWEVHKKSGLSFPHIYGTLNTDAVTKIENLDSYIKGNS
jgi:uncharacterized protein (DUF952 family)